MIGPYKASETQDNQRSPLRAVGQVSNGTAAILWQQHVTSLSGRYADSGFTVSTPTMPFVAVRLRSDGDLVQLIHWIRCYEYQTCRGASWPTSFAREYCSVA